MPDWKKIKDLLLGAPSPETKPGLMEEDDPTKFDDKVKKMPYKAPDPELIVKPVEVNMEHSDEESPAEDKGELPGKESEEDLIHKRLMDMLKRQKEIDEANKL